LVGGTLREKFEISIKYLTKFIALMLQGVLWRAINITFLSGSSLIPNQIYSYKSNQIKSFIGPQVTIFILIKMTIQVHIHILWPGSYKIAQAIFTQAPLVQKNND
jgi:hypothetical protein